ncbi:hypothetical protein PAXRUDRAFT_828421 [Paxillus rubicundulus Ve08.2h10]|uniref:Uncharacterized protein n=1 Tax=Paxillus rubicundulus Ve08.2h10 TaxID=930991 RepID=A0A0D0DPR2_9AGAM|nr:hypothetical protein PAXRUDRAFT_828421 [Paxillus rubicundulus Ve08.2h10]
MTVFFNDTRKRLPLTTDRSWAPVRRAAATGITRIANSTSTPGQHCSPELKSPTILRSKSHHDRLLSSQYFSTGRSTKLATVSVCDNS